MLFFLHFGLTIFITKLGNYFSSKEARLDRYLYAKGKFSFEVTAKVSVEENSFGEGAGETLLGGSVLKKYLLRLSQEETTGLNWPQLLWEVLIGQSQELRTSLLSPVAYIHPPTPPPLLQVIRFE